MSFAGIIGAAWAVALSAVSFAAAPTRIDFTARPEGAKVFVDGVSKGIAPVSVFDAGAGSHYVRVEADGCRPVHDVVNVSEGDFLTRDYELERQKGLLLVKTDPPGAEVKADGMSLGVTPLLVTSLDADGSYVLDISSVGYQAKKIVVRLSGRTPTAVSEKLVLDSGVVECSSEPSGATVLVDGIARGTTPCRIGRVPKGYATFVFRMKGYEDEKRELRIAPGEEQSLSVLMKGLAAKLSLISYPAGANITMDGNYAGKTPLSISPVKPGVHTVKAELEGYAPVFKTVVMENGGEVTEDFRFESILGWIEITTIPPGAKIVLDGKTSGKTAAHRGKKADLSQVKSDILYIRDVKAGEHSLAAHLKGYADAKGSVKVEPQKATKVNLRLKRVFIPDTEIETVSGTYRGVLMDSDDPGAYRLEVREGIMQGFLKKDVRSIKSLE